MKRLLALIVAIAPLAASAPAEPRPQLLDQKLEEAQAEEAAAEAETARLEKAVAGARNEAERLEAKQAAAAQAIESAEARITAADAQFRLAAAYVAANRERLANEQRPVSSLLAGLAVMAQRPALLAVADGGGTDELVKVGILLDATMPVIERRTHALSAQLAEGQRLKTRALVARAELIRSRKELMERQRQFAQLAKSAIEHSLAAGGRALKTSDVAIAAAEQVEQLQSEAKSSRSARQSASLLAAEGPMPARPLAAAGNPSPAPFPYALPVTAQVLEGLGAVNDSGVRSRGISFATVRGVPVRAPADGVVRFSGPFRDYDGIVLLDHGRGWMSLIVNLSSPLKAGDQVKLGDPVGRALGGVTVQLSHDGRRFSPALIAGSSQSLSKAAKGG